MAACELLLRFSLVFPCSVWPPVVEEETPIPWAACRCRFHPLLRSCFPVNPPPRSTSRSTVKVPLQTSRSEFVTFLNSQRFCRHNRIVCNDDFYDIQKSHSLSACRDCQQARRRPSSRPVLRIAEASASLPCRPRRQRPCDETRLAPVRAPSTRSPRYRYSALWPVRTGRPSILPLPLGGVPPRAALR